MIVFVSLIDFRSYKSSHDTCQSLDYMHLTILDRRTDQLLLFSSHFSSSSFFNFYHIYLPQIAILISTIINVTTIQYMITERMLYAISRIPQRLLLNLRIVKTTAVPLTRNFSFYRALQLFVLWVMLIMAKQLCWTL